MNQKRQIGSTLLIIATIFVTINGISGFPFDSFNEGTASLEGEVLSQPSVKLVRIARSSKDPLDLLGRYNEIEQNQLRYQRHGFQNAFEVMDAVDTNVINGRLNRPV